MKVSTLKALTAPLETATQTPLNAGFSEVVVRLKAAALNRRDFWITQGQYPGIQLPVTLGSDGAGVVTSVGGGVDPSWVGQSVIINPSLQWGSKPEAQGDEFSILGMPRNGTLASEITIPATQLHPKPDHLDWHTAAALPLAGLTAWRALFTQASLTPADRVLVTGIGGGVATFALQFATAAGASVIVTSSLKEKRERALQFGASAAYDYRDPDWTKRFKDEFGSFSVAIDGAGGPGYAQLIDLAVPGGRIVNYGATAGLNSQIDLFKLFWKQLQLVGSTMGSPVDFTQMLQFVNRHKIVPIVDQVFPLEQVNVALQRMGQAEQFGKIVIELP